MSKLVRNKIPQILQANGKRCIYKTVQSSEYESYLKDKLIEECNELLRAVSKTDIVEELADIYQVIYDYAAYHGISFTQVKDYSFSKYLAKGGFDKGVVLVEVEE